MEERQTTNDMTRQQLDQWGRAALGWKRWAEVFAQRDDASLYLDAAGIEPGHHVLEVGAGTGDQTLALAERVGPDGGVVATDLTPGMLAIARERIETAGFDNVAFQIADAADLGYDDDGFDAVVSGFTWMLIPDPVAAAAEVRRVLVPGGRFAVSVWGPPPTVPMLAVPMGVLVNELGIEPPAPEGPGLFSLAHPDRLGAVFEGAGMENVSVAPFNVRLRFPSPEDYAAFTRDVAVVVSDLVSQHAPDRTEEIWGKVADRMRDSVAADGSVVFENQALLATGSRPG